MIALAADVDKLTREKNALIERLNALVGERDLARDMGYALERQRIRLTEERDTNHRNYQQAIAENEGLRGIIEHLKGRKAYYKQQHLTSLDAWRTANRERKEAERKVKNVEIVRDAARLLDESVIRLSVIEDALGPEAKG